MYMLHSILSYSFCMTTEKTEHKGVYGFQIGMVKSGGTVFNNH